MRHLGEDRPLTWWGHVRLALTVIPPVRRVAYVYALLLLGLWVVASVDDYRELARLHQVKARATLQVDQPNESP